MRIVGARVRLVSGVGVWMHGGDWGCGRRMLVRLCWEGLGTGSCVGVVSRVLCGRGVNFNVESALVVLLWVFLVVVGVGLRRLRQLGALFVLYLFASGGDRCLEVMSRSIRAGLLSEAIKVPITSVIYESDGVSGAGDG